MCRHSEKRQGNDVAMLAWETPPLMFPEGQVLGVQISPQSLSSQMGFLLHVAANTFPNQENTICVSTACKCLAYDILHRRR